MIVEEVILIFFFSKIKIIINQCYYTDILTRTFAASDLEGPCLDRAVRATSAAACSACLSALQNAGLSKFSPLKLTTALNRGA